MRLILKNTKTGASHTETLNGHLVIQGTTLFDVITEQGFDEEPTAMFQLNGGVWDSCDGKGSWDDITVSDTDSFE